MTNDSLWVADDAALKRISEIPFKEVIDHARNNELAALNHLYRVCTKPVLRNLVLPVCGRLSHMGSRCTGSKSDTSHALDSGLQYGLQKTFGYTPKKEERETNANAVFDGFREGDPERIDHTKRSVLTEVSERIADAVAPEVLGVESWSRLVNNYCGHKGYADEIARQWNVSRGLSSRLDQSSYFLRPGNDEYTELFKRFNEIWKRNAELLPHAAEKDQDFRNLLELLAVIEVDFTNPRHVIKFLKVLYSDACENTWTDNNPIDPARLRRGLVHEKFISDEHAASTSDALLVQLVSWFEDCLSEAYPDEYDDDQKTILVNLRLARAQSRVLPKLTWSDDQNYFDRFSEDASVNWREQDDDDVDDEGDRE